MVVPFSEPALAVRGEYEGGSGCGVCAGWEIDMLIILNELGQSCGSNCCGARMDMEAILRGRRGMMRIAKRKKRSRLVSIAELWMGSRRLV